MDTPVIAHKCGEIREVKKMGWKNPGKTWNKKGKLPHRSHTGMERLETVRITGQTEQVSEIWIQLKEQKLRLKRLERKF